MAKIGDEAELILRLAKERLQKRTKDLEDINTDFTLAKAQGIQEAIAVYEQVVYDLESGRI